MDGVKRRRLNRACVGCGIVRCQGSSDNPPCPRCVTLQIECVFRQSHKGRVHGSKNLKTIERERNADRAIAQPEPSNSTLDIPRVYPSAMPALDLQRVEPIPTPDLSDSDGQDDAEETFNDPMMSLLHHSREQYGLKDSSLRSTRSAGVSLPPSEGLSPEEHALLAKWTTGDIEQIVKQQTFYSSNGVHAHKRDIGPGLDPVSLGLIKSSRVNELFTAFWLYIHPQWSVLDPELHTPQYVKTHSAFLYTVILAIASTALATRAGTESDVAEAIKMQGHAERLLLMTFAIGAKSCEIIQAHILFHVWSFSGKRYIDDNRWVRMSMCSRMALELGLHKRKRGGGLNEVRTRAFLIMVENRWTLMSSDAIPGVFSIALTEDEVSELSSVPSEMTTSNAAALYTLGRFSREETEKLATISSEPFGLMRLVSESSWVQTFIDEWMVKWCTPHRTALQNWYLRFVAASTQLVLVCRIMRRLENDEESRKALTTEIVDLALELLRQATDNPDYLTMLNHSMSLPFASLLVLKFAPSRFAAVTRCALHFAGDPRRPGAALPTFTKFNADQMMAMVCMHQMRRGEPEERTAAGDSIAAFLAGLEDFDPFYIPLQTDFEGMFQSPSVPGMVFDPFQQELPEGAFPPFAGAGIELAGPEIERGAVGEGSTLVREWDAGFREEQAPTRSIV